MSQDYSIVHGEVVDTLQSWDLTDYYDACLCDPPYLLEFMGKAFDRQHKSMAGDNDGQRMYQWHLRWCREVYKVLKPGGFVLAFGGTRTSHRLACALEDVGFEIRDTIEWMYGSGFPKSYDISKGIDKLNGHERVVTRPAKVNDDFRPDHIDMDPRSSKDRERKDLPGSEQSALWSGYGTALKPAHEPIILAMKPCTGTFAENALEYGVAGLNIDECRIQHSNQYDKNSATPQGKVIRNNFAPGEKLQGTETNRPSTDGGRYPANLILSHTPWCQEVGTRRVRSNNQKNGKQNIGDNRTGSGLLSPSIDSIRSSGYGDSSGLETVTAWNCHPLCPVRLLDEQSGPRGGGFGVRGVGNGKVYAGGKGYSNTLTTTGQTVGYGDRGGASRFFASFKPDTCWICCNPIPKHATMNEWDANDAALKLSKEEDSALGDVRPLPRQQQEEKDKKRSSARSAAKRLSVTSATIESTVPDNARTSQSEQNDLSVLSVVSLCERCTTAIVPVLVELPTLPSEEQLAGLASIIGLNKPTLYLSLVLVVENLESIDITEIIQILQLWSGCVQAAIDAYTILERSDQSLRLDQTSHQGLTRFRYVPKVLTRERNLGGINCRHPTLKPIDLCRYLATLLLPPVRPDDTRKLLIPFSGAGSEVAGALLAGWDDVTGIEQDAEYVQWSEARVRAVLRGELQEKGSGNRSRRGRGRSTGGAGGTVGGTVDTSALADLFADP